MRRYSVFLWVLLVISIFLVSNASAYEYGVAQGDQIKLSAPGGPNGGGEFNWTNLNNEYQFESFCLEKNEHIAFNGTYNVGSITNGAINGGVGGPNPDPISNQTAWLFWNFSRGDLTGYDHSYQLQGELQELIWWFEEEIPLEQGLSFTGLQNTWLGLAETTDWVNQGEVMVLNLGSYTLNDNLDAIWVKTYQDQLIAAAPVPEPATMVLLGIGLLFIAGVSRKKLKP